MNGNQIAVLMVGTFALIPLTAWVLLIRCKETRTPKPEK